MKVLVLWTEGSDRSQFVDDGIIVGWATDILADEGDAPSSPLGLEEALFVVNDRGAVSTESLESAYAREARKG